MCALLYAPPTLASSFSNSPLSTTLLTAGSTKYSPSLQNLQTFSLQKALCAATELLISGLCLTFTGRGESREGKQGRVVSEPRRALPRGCKDAKRC